MATVFSRARKTIINIVEAVSSRKEREEAKDPQKRGRTGRVVEGGKDETRQKKRLEKAERRSSSLERTREKRLERRGYGGFC